jgi:hypothetical protein
VFAAYKITVLILSLETDALTLCKIVVLVSVSGDRCVRLFIK